MVIGSKDCTRLFDDPIQRDINGRMIAHGAPMPVLVLSMRAGQARYQATVPRCGRRTRRTGEPCRTPTALHPITSNPLPCYLHAGGHRYARKCEYQKLREIKGRDRRVANRLKAIWKRDRPFHGIPWSWYPGQTVELNGFVENKLCEQIADIYQVHLEQLPPAVIDWLRWQAVAVYADRRVRGQGTRLNPQGTEAGLLDLIRSELPRRMHGHPVGSMPTPDEIQRLVDAQDLLERRFPGRRITNPEVQIALTEGFA